MLVVKVELWPDGRKSGVRTLARMRIVNVGGTESFGNYEVTAYPTRDTPRRENVVVSHPRLSSPVWTLIAKAIKSVGFGS